MKSKYLIYPFFISCVLTTLSFPSFATDGGESSQMGSSSKRRKLHEVGELSGSPEEKANKLISQGHVLVKRDSKN